MVPISSLLALALLPAALGVPHQQPFAGLEHVESSVPSETPITSAPDDMERYDGHKVWRIDWSGIGESSKHVLHDILEVSLLSGTDAQQLEDVHP